MHFPTLLAALTALSAPSLTLALPTNSPLLPRAPSGTAVSCGVIPPGKPAPVAGDVHVWQKVDTETVTYHGPGGKSDVDFHKDLNHLQDLIGGSHYDILFGLYKADKTWQYNAVGLQIDQKGWTKTNPSAKGAKIDIYEDDLGSKLNAGKPSRRGLQHADEEDVEKRAAAKPNTEICYYKGIVAAGSTIKNAADAHTAATNYYKSKTYEVNVNDCVKSSDYILSQIKFK